MDAGRIIAIGPVDEVFDRYYGDIQDAAASTSADAGQPVKQGRSRAEFIPAAPLANELAQCLGGSVETLDGVLCERPEI